MLKILRKALYLFLILCLVVGCTLTYLPSMKLQVLAEAAPNVFYVDGVGSGLKDGTTKENAFKTVTDAYNAIPSDNEVTYIIICGEVSLVEGAENVKDGYPNYIALPPHTGKVVITSHDGNEDYRTTGAKLDLQCNGENNIWLYLLGDTVFENITFSGTATQINASFFPLHFGKGIDTVNDENIAGAIYMGTGGSVKHYKDSISARDIQLTIDSGKFGSVYGGTIYNQTSVIKLADMADKSVTITVNGGTIKDLCGSGARSLLPVKSVAVTVNGGSITNLYGMGAGENVSSEVKVQVNDGTITNLYGVGEYGAKSNTTYTTTLPGNLEVVVNGGAVTTVNAIQDSDTVPGNVTIVGSKNIGFKGNGQDTESVFVSSVQNFDTLKLDDCTLEINDAENWTGFTKVQLTDNSLLQFGFTPTISDSKISVEVTPSGSALQTQNPIIRAQAGTADIFQLTAQEDYELVYDSDNASWTLKSLLEEAAPNVFYVDGVGSGLKDGTTKENAFKTVTDAYNAMNALGNNSDETVTYIIICGEVSLVEGAEVVNDKGTYYALPLHTGKVVITSKYGDEDYKTTGAKLDLKLNGEDGKIWLYLLGDTVFENITFSGTATQINASFFPLHFGKGIDTVNDKNIAGAIYMGTGGSVKHYKNSINARDIQLTIDSGIFDKVYGGTIYSQTSVISLADMADKSVTITVNGGTIKDLCGSAARSYLPVKSVAVTVNGGTIENLYGMGAAGDVSSEVKVQVNDGTITNLYGVGEYGAKSGSTYTTTLPGNLEVMVNGGTVTTVNAIQDSDTVPGNVTIVGSKIIGFEGNGQGTESVSMPSVQNFDTLKLTGCTLEINDAENWTGFTKVQLTDNSLLQFGFIPTISDSKISVEVTPSGSALQTQNPIIKAQAGTADIFQLTAPLNYELVYDSDNAFWTLGQAELAIGEEGQPGDVLNLDLGLPESFTPLEADATNYEIFLQKLEDMGAASTEVRVVQPVEVKGEVELYVSPTGNDNNNGSKDAPFYSISKALSMVESLNGLNVEGVVIYLRKGTYLASDPVYINETHESANGIPVIISAYNDEEVIISGGTNISGDKFVKVTDEAVLNRLQAPVRDKIMVVDLKALGISEFGTIVGYKEGANYSVSMNGEPLTIARYPDAAELRLGEVLDPGPVKKNSNFPSGSNADSTGVKFVMQDLRPTLWYNDGNIWLYGNLGVEWDFRHKRVSAIRTDNNSIELDGDILYGAVSHINHTYFYYNVLEELNVPGEFYLDGTNGKLYLYPISDMENATITYTAMSKDIINISNTANIVLNGLIVENTSGTGINVDNCNNTLIQNCVIRQVDTGAIITGKNNGIIYSEIYGTGSRPVHLGKYECSLDFTAEENFVQNCYIYNTGTMNVRTSQIYINGAGNVVSHNLIQGTGGASINTYGARECIVEYNEIVGGPNDGYDMASIYNPNAPGNMGNHIRYNYIHDTGRFSKQHNPHSIYMDDGSRSSFIYGNIMVNVQDGIFIHYGSDHVVLNNIVMSTREGRNVGIHGNEKMADKTIQERWDNAKNAQTIYEHWLGLSAEEKASFKNRYPNYAELHENVEAAMAAAGGSAETGVGTYMAEGNYAQNNILVFFEGVELEGRDNVSLGNEVLNEDPFVDAANHNYALKNSASLGFDYQAPDMSKIGIVLEEAEKDGMGAFELYAPANGFDEVDPYNVLLKWTLAGGADTYELILATNEDLTENVKQMTLEKTNCYFERDEYFSFGKTYYWKVVANTTAESRDTTLVESTVFSFKTMTEEKYYEYNKADLGELESTIAEAESFIAEMTEISEGGLYYEGSKEIYQAAINDAKAVLDAGIKQDQAVVNAAVAELIDSTFIAKANRIVQYVTFENIDASEWSDPSNLSGSTTVEDGELRFVTTKNKTEMAYSKWIGNRDILCFQYKLDTLTSWPGFGIGQNNMNAFVTGYAATNSYLICIKADVIELQKRNNGKKYGENGDGIIAVVENNNEIITSGVWYDIQLAALQNADGTVRIIFKVDDQVVFDYLDEVEPIIGDNGFGVILHKDNGTGYLKKANLNEVDNADYSALDAELQKEQELTAGDYTEASWNAYQLIVEEAEKLSRDLTDGDQAIIDQLVADLEAAREALVKVNEPTEKPVVTVNGKEYNGTLLDAIETAESGATIKLLGDIDLGTEHIQLENSVTLDLNGKTLTAPSLIAFEGTKVVDNSGDKTGLLKVAEKQFAFNTDANNPQMPVYNGTNGYVFATIKPQEQRNSAVGNDIFELIFRPSLGTGTVVNNTLLASGGSAAKISIGIRLEWTDKDGKPQSKVLVYKDDMVDEVYSNGKAFYIKASGVNSFTNLKITPLVQSQLNENIVWNGTVFAAN